MCLFMMFGEGDISGDELNHRSASFKVELNEAAQRMSKNFFALPLYFSVISHSGVTRVGDTRGGNWRCHPSIFSWKTWRPFFAHRCHYHYRLSLLLLSLGCLPSRVGCHLFFLSDLVSPLFFINLPAKFFSFGCHPPDGVTRGGPPPHPLVTPLISQTANKRPVNSTCICEVWFQAELIKLTPMLSPSLP